jgi:cobaltochelatase CobN
MAVRAARGAAGLNQDANATGFLYLTQADTDLLSLSRAVPLLPPDFPPVAAFNLSQLKTAEEVDGFLAAQLPAARVIIMRLHGGRQSFRDGFDRVVEHARGQDKWLICMPGIDELDPELTAVSNVGVPVTHEAMAYLQLGGVANFEHLLRFLSDHLLASGFGFDPPQPQPRHGVYHPDVPEGTLDAWRARAGRERPTIGVLLYRSHVLSGNVDFVDALVRAGEARGANVLPVYAYSLKEYAEDDEARDPGRPRLPAALRYFVGEGRTAVDAIICTMSFAMGGSDGQADGDAHWSTAVLQSLDVPVLQAITASTGEAQWAESTRGLTPLDTAMNVAIPELDGRIVTTAVSFKEEAADSAWSPAGTTVVKYLPQPDRVERVIGQALRLIALRRKPLAEKRIAFVLTNYTTKASRIANAVGLDSPASLLRLLKTMREAGYTVGDLPPDGDTLLQGLIDRGSYDREILTEAQIRDAVARVPAAQYKRWFEALPEKNRDEMAGRWEAPPGRYYVDDDGTLALAGIDFGNVFVAVQPPRGYGLDPAAIYHLPDLPPPHTYYALYHWLTAPVEDGGWQADAIVHLGKHGTLEWLPGKSIGISGECYPDIFLGDLPLVYPFIINNPGEGAQAKRRTHAVIVDHLTPPMTTAEGYEEIEQLSRLVDEYYQLEQLDPSKLPLLQQQIWELIRQANLDSDLEHILDHHHDDDDDDHDHHDHDDHDHDHEGLPEALTDLSGKEFAHLVEDINGYICELTSAQIRDGLHTLGEAPRGEQLIDSLLSLVRLPNLDIPSLRAGLAACFGLDLDAILGDLGRRLTEHPTLLEAMAGRPAPTNADALEAIDLVAKCLVADLAGAGFAVDAVPEVLERWFGEGVHTPGFSLRYEDGLSSVARTLAFIAGELVPNLRRAGDEITNLLHALDGGYIPAGPSGAPTRGMAHVLPTGRNFYTVDPRALPSKAAWQVGEQLADGVLKRHLAEEGTYPESVGISIWGTSAMRTHGDDIGQVLALLGVRPRWQTESRRVEGIDVIPLAELGRPRIDVICRISGFFRDAFPHLISLMDDAFKTVAGLDEPLDANFVRRHYLATRDQLTRSGMTADEAATRAGYRIFGCKPGTYGAGILPLIDEQNWRDAADFAEAYVNWGGYAYTSEEHGIDARDDFRGALNGVQIAIKNQDNREHDIFDSDDYLQYHGGMIATIRSLTGRNPKRYFGDNSDPGHTRVRELKEEALRVFRTRVINPKWLASVQRHGYKGALELAATVDYIFGYDATADVVDDWMYADVAKEYALNPAMQEFFKRSNPWALRDITARLLEAADRGMWAEPGELRAALESTFLATEADIEARTEDDAPAASRGRP